MKNHVLINPCSYYAATSHMLKWEVIVGGMLRLAIKDKILFRC
jgi:hypothetical protein